MSLPAHGFVPAVSNTQTCRIEAAPLSRDEHPIRLGVAMPALALVNVDARGTLVSHSDELIHRRGERMAVTRIALHRLGGEHEPFGGLRHI